MTIPAIAPITPFAPLTPPTGAVGASNPTSGAGFAAQLSNGLEQLQQSQTQADNLAVKAATGDLTDVHDYMIASSQASLGMQLTVALRNKAVDAFNEIMRMQG